MIHLWKYISETYYYVWWICDNDNIKTKKKKEEEEEEEEEEEKEKEKEKEKNSNSIRKLKGNTYKSRESKRRKNVMTLR